MNRNRIRMLITLLALMSLLIPTSVAMAQGGSGGGSGGGNGGGKGGGGGHTETVGNNLSFPVIWSDSVAIPLRGAPGVDPTLTVPYSETTIDCGGVDGYAYAQKVEGNEWQAESVFATAQTAIDQVDWGDSLESVNMKIGRPVRIELSLYKLEVAMKAYDMFMLANPSSPDEVQGVCALVKGEGASTLSHISSEATIYTPLSKLVIQPLIGAKENIDEDDLLWAENQWVDGDLADPDGVGAPLTVVFSAELNVAGKVIYGLSQGGWKPTAVGDYRITFYLPTYANTVFDEETTIRVSTETEAIVAEAEDTGGGLAYVDPEHNLTYIDITVVAGGGGGGGGGKGKPGADVDVLRESQDECACECLCLEECLSGQDCECDCQCEETCPNCAPLQGSDATINTDHVVYLPMVTH